MLVQSLVILCLHILPEMLNEIHEHPPDGCTTCKLNRYQQFFMKTHPYNFHARTAIQKALRSSVDNRQALSLHFQTVLSHSGSNR
jgi:hypothetical protein